jgi:hypothetical protein
MHTLLKCMELVQNQNKLYLLSLTQVNASVHIAYLLYCDIEGTVYGQRTFLLTTQFDGPDDLLDELWCSDLGNVHIPLTYCKRETNI